jgi:hypothetical protein
VLVLFFLSCLSLNGRPSLYGVFRWYQSIEVFTTRSDTLLGVTYLTLAPEHPLVSSVTTSERKDEVDAYVQATSSRSDMDRTASKEKTGVFTGGYAIHPLSGERVPVWVGDYVLGSYGTGAVMAVPAHDTRDFEFAQKFGLEIKWVVQPVAEESVELNTEEAFTEYGVAMNSGDFDGMKTEQCKKAISNKLKEMGKGGPKITYMVASIRFDTIRVFQWTKLICPWNCHSWKISSQEPILRDVWPVPRTGGTFNKMENGLPAKPIQCHNGPEAVGIISDSSIPRTANKRLAKRQTVTGCRLICM